MNHPEDNTNTDDERRRRGPTGAPRTEVAVRHIREAIEGLRYGSVLVIVQDGVVVQIERTEKTRFDR